MQGRVQDNAELARLAQVSPARITQIVSLGQLATYEAIQELHDKILRLLREKPQAKAATNHR